MGLLHAGLLILLSCSSYCYQSTGRAGHGVAVRDPEHEWERMTALIGEAVTEAPAPESKLRSSGYSTLAAKKFPEYVIASFSNSQKEVFKPEKGARQLPPWVKEMLLLSSFPTFAPGRPTRIPQLVEMLCHVDRMYVRIRREVFRSRNAFKFLKLGSCPVNKASKDHFYLLYLLKADCGFKKESNTDYYSVSNVLNYMPNTPVLRDMPFVIKLQCKFPRLFHSYKVGFHPTLRGGTVFKALQPRSRFTLTHQDALGNDLTGSKTYTLGQPMYFQAKGPAQAASIGKRLYISKCFTTTSQDPYSNPKYTIIDNYGCMTDGKETLVSKFLPDVSKAVQKFCVSAFIFKATASTTSPMQLFMHCEIFMGPPAPTCSSKACNFDPVTRRWKELYGPDYVCNCCDSTCPSPKPSTPRKLTVTLGRLYEH